MANHVLQLDRLLRTSLTAFVADATAEQWHGKERDCVNRLVMRYLVGASDKHHFPEQAIRICMESAVAPPPRFSLQPTAPYPAVNQVEAVGPGG